MKSAYHSCKSPIENYFTYRSFSYNGRESSSCMIQLMWLATKFSLFFLSLISRLNSYRRRIHLTSLGFTSFFISKYLRVVWSKNIVTLMHSKYYLNFSKNNNSSNFFQWCSWVEHHWKLWRNSIWNVVFFYFIVLTILQLHSH